jgi:trimeric autotransporter adhesin
LHIMKKNYLIVAAFFAFTCTAQAQTITTYAGTGGIGYTGDNGPATAAQFNNPLGGTAMDASNNLYIADPNNWCVRKVNSAGVITTFAGAGATATALGDGGPATAALIMTPSAVAVDAAGNVYIVDYNQRIRKVTPAGIISTVAGNGTAGSSGDNGPATAAQINLATGIALSPGGIALDKSGNIYISDYGNSKVRMISVTSGKITTFAGNGTAGSTGDGSPATAAELQNPSGIAFDASGNAYISDFGNSRVRVVMKSNGNIYPFAGTGTSGFTGDGAAATAATLKTPTGLAFDGSGSLYVADAASNAVRRISGSTSVIKTVAGNGIAAFMGDNGPATAAELSDPVGLTFDATGNMYITDAYNNRVRKVTPILTIDILGSSTPVCKGKTAALSDAITGGTWSSSNTAVATVNTTGVVTGVALGTATISYTTPTDGTTATITVAKCNVGVSNTYAAENGLQVYPNPNYGQFNILLSSADDEQAIVTITNLIGVKIREIKISTNKPEEISIDAPPGIYFLSAASPSGRWSEKIILSH